MSRSTQQRDLYAHWLRQQHRYAANSLLAIERDLQSLCRLLLSTDEPDWAALDADRVRAALARARAQGASAATIARLTSSWRGFCRYLVEQGILHHDPLEGVRAPRKPRRLPKALSPDEAVRLVSADIPDDNRLLQATALAELLYGTGLRLSEALGLDRAQAEWRLRVRSGGVIGGWIDWSAGEVHVVGKGGKPRVVPLTTHARAALSGLLSLPVVWPPDYAERPLFIAPRGRRLPARSAQRDLAALARTAGLPRHLHPHMLRHSFASHVLQSSGDLRAVQELMGHASIASTQVYTALDFQHLSAAYDQAHPRARKRIASGN